jgi:DNA helicase II / ATP-dependent DNA helicase PcrA
VSVTSPLLDGLNDIQREAVLRTEGPVLIVAGAGSGKTRALTHRIAYLIRECGVSPGEILAITFTNKASREMAERVGELLGGPISRGMWVLTFHSACVRILRKEHAHLGVPSNFTIYDDGDTERLIAGISRDMNVDPKRFPAKAIASAIGKAKDRVIGATEFAGMASSLYEETVSGIYTEYERRKRDAGALDFDDLISETVRLFRDHPEILKHYQERFRYILVDEYQDTNRAQYELRLLLARGNHPEHPRLRARLSRRGRVLDGTELPLHAEHPHRSERAHREQRSAEAEEPLDRGGIRRSGRTRSSQR